MNISATHKGHDPEAGKDLQVTQYRYDRCSTKDSSWSLEQDLSFWKNFQEAGIEAKKAAQRQEPKPSQRKAPTNQGKALQGENPQMGGLPKAARKLTKKTKKPKAPAFATTKLPSQMR